MTDAPHDSRLLWVDVETTGLTGPGPGNLDDGGLLLEVGLILTEADLDVIDTISCVVAYPANVIDDARARVAPYVEEMHTANGLWGDVTSAGYGLETVERHLLGWARDGHRVQPRTLPMAGSSVHTDRQWLAGRMPSLEAFFRYRTVDVSTVKELVRRWYGPEKQYREPTRKGHRTLVDLRDSISELRHYRAAVFAGSGHSER